jgi:hypothetical protein
MKFVEIASAEEQLALWKLVNDSVWAAIQRQSEDERKRRAAQRAASKPKPKAKRAAARRRPSQKPITYKPTPKPKSRPQHVRQQAPAPAPPSLSANALPPISLNSGQTTGDFAPVTPPPAAGAVGLSA